MVLRIEFILWPVSLLREVIPNELVGELVAGRSGFECRTWRNRCLVFLQMITDIEAFAQRKAHAAHIRRIILLSLQFEGFD